MLDDLGQNSALSEEKRLFLQEIKELNEERIRQDEEQDRTFIEPDEKKKIERLEKFVKESHTLLEMVEIPKLFSQY